MTKQVTSLKTSPTRRVHELAAQARPFLKWAGGKSQLLDQFEKHFPDELKKGRLRSYVEPFVGAGAVFFHVAQNYPIRKALLIDANEELCLTYKVLKRAPRQLVNTLGRLQDRYLCADARRRERLFYEVRRDFNARKNQVNYGRYCRAWVERAAQLIFLNKTCYNGLFRTNSRGEFNAPFGRYKKPSIFDPHNLLRIAQLLRIAEIRNADFESCEKYVDKATFVYFDPPYRPLSRTANFTSYSRGAFTENDQLRLGRFFARLHRQRHAKLMLSNSDPANVNAKDRFFKDLYGRFSMSRVRATRMINSVAARRGRIAELVITNY